MEQIILVLHVFVAIGVVALVLLQHGKGADIGAAFGSGASNTIFGSAGSVPFLMKITVILAALFFATSLALSYLATRMQKESQQAYITPISTTPIKQVEVPSPLPQIDSDASQQGKIKKNSSSL